MIPRNVFVATAFATLLLAGCRPVQAPAAAAPPAEAESAAGGESGPVQGIPVVYAKLETQPILDMYEDLPDRARFGDMDDPAIWVHPDDPARSVVAAVMKEGGLEVYDLDGNVLQSISPDGVRYNNIDLRYGFPLGGQTVDLLVATDRFGDKLAIFVVDPATGTLRDVSDPANPLLFTPDGQASDETTTAYGIALYRDPATGGYSAFVNRRSTGDLAQFELVDNGQGQVSVRKVRDLDSLPPPEGGEAEDAQTEGMVVDDALGFLYVGQENAGIWKFSVDPAGGTAGTLIHKVEEEGGYLLPDVEGLTLYAGPNDSGYLLASSQGDNTFAVFTRDGDNSYLGSFQVGGAGDLDGAQESDGAMVVNVALGERFPNGLLVVQDGFNLPAVMVEDDGELENVSTNLKFVDWADVAAAFDPPLMVDTTPIR